MALVKRLVKGSPLTFAEGDANLDYLESLARSSSAFNNWTGSNTSQFSGTSSYATTASYINPTFISASAAASGFGSGGGGSTSGLLSTASFNNYTGSATSQFAGTSSFATTASYALNGGGGTAVLSSSLLTNITVGGLTSGTSYTIGTTLESIFRTMLVTYIAPTISAFTLKNGASTVFFSTDYVEVSSSLTFNTASFTATADNPNGRFAYSASFTASGANTGDFNYYFGNNVLGTSNNLGLGSSRVVNKSSDGIVTFTLNTRNPQTNAVISSAANLIYVYPYFYGMSATNYSSSGDLVNDGNITKLITGQNSQTLLITGSNQFIHFAYPSSYGNLTSIKDGNDFDVTTAFTKYTRTQNGASGYWTGVSYNIYISEKTSVNPSQNYKFNY